MIATGGTEGLADWIIVLSSSVTDKHGESSYIGSDSDFSNDRSVSFIKDIAGLESQLNAHFNSDDLKLSQMLLDFFEFYANFNFDRNALCCLTGLLQPSRTNSYVGHGNYELDITNPLEPDLNVSVNVRRQGLAKFQKQCKTSHKILSFLLQESEHKQKLFDLFELSGGNQRLLNVSIKDLGFGVSSNNKENLQMSKDVREDEKERLKLSNKLLNGDSKVKKVTYKEDRRMEKLKKVARVPNAKNV